MSLFEAEFDDARMRELLEQIARNPATFRHTRVALAEWGETAVSQWIKLVESRSESIGQPGFFVRGYLGDGNRNIRWEEDGPLEIRVFQTNGGAKYDFGSVIEHGRRPWDFRNILNSARNVRVSKAGVRYVVIPLPPGEKKADFAMHKTGEVRKIAGTGVLNTYTYARMGKGNVAQFQQRQLNGVHTSGAALVTLTERSNWRPYPQIRGFRYSQAIQDVIETGRARIKTEEGAELNFKASLARAIARDLLEATEK